MNNHPFATFRVGLKALFHDGDKILLLRTSKSKRYDFPGGRIDATEYEKPLLDILNRELREELGDDIRYKVGGPLFQFRRNYRDTETCVFTTVYDAEYIGGEIKLSEEHSAYEWVKPDEYEFDLKQFIGEEEYQALKQYLASQQPR